MNHCVLIKIPEQDTTRTAIRPQPDSLDGGNCDTPSILTGALIGQCPSGPQQFGMWVDALAQPTRSNSNQ